MKCLLFIIPLLSTWWVNIKTFSTKWVYFKHLYIFFMNKFILLFRCIYIVQIILYPYIYKYIHIYLFLNIIFWSCLLFFSCFLFLFRLLFSFIASFYSITTSRWLFKIVIYRLFKFIGYFICCLGLLEKYMVHLILRINILNWRLTPDKIFIVDFLNKINSSKKKLSRS